MELFWTALCDASVNRTGASKNNLNHPLALKCTLCFNSNRQFLGIDKFLTICWKPNLFVEIFSTSNEYLRNVLGSRLWFVCEQWGQTCSTGTGTQVGCGRLKRTSLPPDLKMKASVEILTTLIKPKKAPQPGYVPPNFPCSHILTNFTPLFVHGKYGCFILWRPWRAACLRVYFPNQVILISHFLNIEASSYIWDTIFFSGEGRWRKKRVNQCRREESREAFSKSQKVWLNPCQCWQSRGVQHSAAGTIPFWGCALPFTSSSCSASLLLPWLLRGACPIPLRGTEDQLSADLSPTSCVSWLRNWEKLGWEEVGAQEGSRGAKAGMVASRKRPRNRAAERLSGSNLRMAWVERSLGKQREEQTWGRTELAT